MNRKIVNVALLVADYDEAIDYYTRVLGFELLEDEPSGADKRWVVVAPRGDGATRLLLARAADDRQRAAIGNQTGGRVFLFMHTDDFPRDYEALQAAGVRFCETPRDEKYGRVVVFEDLYGNKWDLIEPRA